MIVRDTELVVNAEGGHTRFGGPSDLVEAIYRISVVRLTFSRMNIVAFDDAAGVWQSLLKLDGEGKPVRDLPTKGRIAPGLRELALRFSKHAYVVEDYLSAAHPVGVHLLGEEGMRSGIHAFILRGGRPAGGIFIQHVEPGTYTERDGPFVHALGHAVGVILDRLGGEVGTPGSAVVEPRRETRDEPSGNDDAGSTRIIGSSAPMRRLAEMMEQVASTEATVLILGETGTGKELVATRIHELSARRTNVFVTVNCAALSRDLVASELFGHVAGAFTGASSTRKGRFELADGGTLFLDEVGDLSWDTQVRLLRVLESGEFQRVGSNKTLKTDVRIIAATHRNLAGLAADGQFRSDLYFRLNVFPIHVPPLRDRDDDITELTHYFLRLCATRAGRPTPHICDEVLDAFRHYSWIGNVRELRNVVERAVILCKYGSIGNEQLPEVFTEESAAALGPVVGCLPNGPIHATSTAIRSGDERDVMTLDEVARMHILKTLKRCDGKISGKGGAAQLLGINPKTLESKMRKLGIRRGWT